MLCTYVNTHTYTHTHTHTHTLNAQDAYDTWVWLTENAGSFGVDPHRMGIGGDSGGGNISAVACQRLLKENFPIRPKYGEPSGVKTSELLMFSDRVRCKGTLVVVWRGIAYSRKTFRSGRSMAIQEWVLKLWAVISNRIKGSFVAVCLARCSKLTPGSPPWEEKDAQPFVICIRAEVGPACLPYTPPPTLPVFAGFKSSSIQRWTRPTSLTRRSRNSPMDTS